MTLSVATFEAEDLAQFGRAMDKLLQKHATIQHLRDLRDQPGAGSFSPDLWRAISEQQLLPDADAKTPLPLPIWAECYASLGRHLAQTRPPQHRRAAARGHPDRWRSRSLR